jgi:hypothetical protein
MSPTLPRNIDAFLAAFDTMLARPDVLASFIVPPASLAT